MPFVKVATLSQLPSNTVTEVTVGSDTYALCNVAGNVTALGGVCLHRGGPLGQGIIRGNHVVCPWHAWQWDCRTGASDVDASKCVPCFEVRVDGDDILLQVP